MATIHLVAEALDQIMERASRALAQVDYLTCEELCLQALRLARERGDWAYYARILLPLQEARRQRRMIAAEGPVRLGTSIVRSPATRWLEQVTSGCIALTRPHTAEQAAELARAARQRRLYVEVLFADCAVDARPWRLRSFRRPEVTCTFAAPPEAWINRWLSAGQHPAAKPRAAVGRSGSPADWFLDACEALGDAALARVEPGEEQPSSVAALEPMLEVAPDHEILHQRLAEAARARRGRVE